MTKRAPLVSVVLPTRDGMHTLPAVLELVRRQRFDEPFEVVAVDSGSTDGTLELLRASADRLLTVDPDDFDHGTTRNLGIDASRGDFVVLLVQDAEPVGDRWLERLVAPLRSADEVAATWCRQRPRPEASSLTRHYLEGWLASSDAAREVAVPDETSFHRLSPMERFHLCAFDNVCSCVRRSVWQQHPFRPTPIAEDLEWAREVLLAGHRIAYTPEAVVVHSHERSSRYEIERTYLVHRRLGHLFGVRTVPSLPALLRAVSSTLPLHLSHWRQDGAAPRLLGRHLGLALAWPLGQYLGGRSAAGSERIGS